MSYENYLQSSHWKATRLKMYRLRVPKCEICKSTKQLNIHHKTYNNLWRETADDLVILCKKCHFLWHEYSKGMRLTDKTLRRAKKYYKYNIGRKETMLSIATGKVPPAKGKRRCMLKKSMLKNCTFTCGKCIFYCKPKK